jgi:pimeloyl-ACP methyl ester carboxylesterase
MPKCRHWIAAFALAALTCLPAAAAPVAALKLSPELCPEIEKLTPAERARVRCGFLSVPETYAKPAGRKIEIAVAVVEPKSNKSQDPVVMLHGGPGGGELQNYRYRLNEPLGARTLVMFDQRGVGHSRPRLCPELGDAIFEASVKGLSADAETAELVIAHNRCHDRLIAEKFNLAAYNTDATVADMEALRRALGLDRWKVYGVSYGSSVALAYLRDHPGRLNGIALDSVYPLDAPPASNSVANMMRALKALSNACTAQPSCKDRFGNLEELFFKALQQLAQAPLEVPAMGATAHWYDAVKISAPAFTTVVHQMLYDQSAYPALPYLIERVAAGDGEVFALMVNEFHARANAITHGQYAAVECFERFPFDARDNYEFASNAWPLARDHMTLLTRHFDICGNWSAKAETPMRMPGRTTVPSLVLAGGWDPITPPSYSKTAAEEIGAHYIELPFHGHGVRGDRACGAPMLRAFLDNPKVSPDASCAKVRRPPEFVTSLIRAPSIARELSALAVDANITEAPTAGTLLLLLTFLLVSTAIWTVVGLTRAARNGASAFAGFWKRPGVPLGLAGIAIAAALGATVAMLIGSAGAVSPILMMIGLPSAALPVFVLPWAAVICLGWGGWALVMGEERADRPAAYAVHLWLAFATAAAAIALVAWFGLLFPQLI